MNGTSTKNANSQKHLANTQQTLSFYDYTKSALIVTTVITTSEIIRRSVEFLWPGSVLKKLLAYVVILLLFVSLFLIIHFREEELLNEIITEEKIVTNFKHY